MQIQRGRPWKAIFFFFLDSNEVKTGQYQQSDTHTHTHTHTYTHTRWPLPIKMTANDNYLKRTSLVFHINDDPSHFNWQRSTMSNFLSGMIMNNILLLLVYFVIIDTAMTLQLLYNVIQNQGIKGMPMIILCYGCVWGILPLYWPTLYH